MPTEQKHTPSTSIDAKRTHTPEPWNTNAHPMEVRAADGSFVAMTVAVPVCIPSAANAARIVACVNACAGMADPAAEIARLRGESQAIITTHAQ